MGWAGRRLGAAHFLMLSSRRIKEWWRGHFCAPFTIGRDLIFCSCLLLFFVIIHHICIAARALPFPSFLLLLLCSFLHRFLSSFFFSFFDKKISKSADALCTGDRLFTSFDQFGSSIAIFQMSYQRSASCPREHVYWLWPDLKPRTSAPDLIKLLLWT